MALKKQVKQKRIIKKPSVVSTGSTLLDLAISGTKFKEGGIPGGIIVEIFGPSASGKTAILAETCANAQKKGGQVMFMDPEARLDKEYCRIYGFHIKEEYYKMPDTVTELFEEIWNWDAPTDADKVNVIAADSLAALSTNLEMEGEDKMGMRRAKEFSEGLRKTCRLINKNNWLVICSNQVRQGQFGETTPGGKAVPFYSSVRISIKPRFQSNQILKTKKLRSGKEVKRVIGIVSECKIVKSSVDVPFREAPVYIIFGYGIDDIRANLQWLKEVNKASKYALDFGSGYQSMDRAIQFIEEKNYVGQLKSLVIETWKDIEKMFEIDRRKK